MGSLISGECYKLFRSKAFRVCSILTVLWFAGTCFLYLGVDAMIHQVINNIPELSLDQDMGEILELTGAALNGKGMLLQTIYVEGTLYLILAIFSTMFVVSEFSRGCIKRLIAKGYHRTHIYLAKLIATLLGSVILFALAGLSGTITATLLWGFGDASGLSPQIMIMVMGSHLLIYMATVCIFVLIAFMIRSMGIVIAVNLILYTILSIFNSVRAFVSIPPDQFHPVDFLLTSLNSKLAGLELSQPLGGAVMIILLVSAGYMILSTVAGCLVFRRQDIR